MGYGISFVEDTLIKSFTPYNISWSWSIGSKPSLESYSKLFIDFSKFSMGSKNEAPEIRVLPPNVDGCLYGHS